MKKESYHKQNTGPIGRYFVFLSVLALSFSHFNLKAQEQLTPLPTLYIQTENNAPIVSKELYLNATYTLVDGGSSAEVNALPGRIKGRGNSTWNMAKKPYKLKFDEKINLLNLPSHEDTWVILNNYADKTLMRNALAFKISATVGLEFTPSVQFLDVVLNDEYIGNYFLTDQVEVAHMRVPVDKQSTDDTSEPAITGGYLVELDGFADSEPVWFATDQGMKVTIKYPKDDKINPAQRDYITNYIREFENRLFSAGYNNPETGYRAMVDEASLINWYIACELTGNSDAFWSTYIYKKNNDPRLYFGPLWDFDIAFNNDNRLGDAAQKLMREHAHNPRQWIQRMWTDPWFKEAVAIRWKELTENGIAAELNTYIQETSTLLEESQQLNFQHWDNLDTRVYLETYLFPTYAQGVDYLSSYVSDRIAFLSAVFEPELPTSLGNQRITKTAAIHPTAVNNDFTVLYSRPCEVMIYNIQGQLVQQNHSPGTGTKIDIGPLPQGIYLVKTGTQVSRIIKGHADAR